MRCLACDTILSDQEAVKKDKRGQYYELCAECLIEEEPEPMADFVYLPIKEVSDETEI